MAILLSSCSIINDSRISTVRSPAQKSCHFVNHFIRVCQEKWMLSSRRSCPAVILEDLQTALTLVDRSQGDVAG
jgi:hypothetical protein